MSHFLSSEPPANDSGMTARERLVLFYTKHQPDNLPKVDEILEVYGGDVDALADDLLAKYGESLLDIQPAAPPGRATMFGSPPSLSSSFRQQVGPARDFVTMDTRSGLWVDGSPDFGEKSGLGMSGSLTRALVRDPSVGGIQAISGTPQKDLPKVTPVAAMGGHAVTRTSGHDLSLRDCLVLYYTKHNPSQLPKVDDVIEQYAGSTDALSAALTTKYGESLYAVSREALSGGGGGTSSNSLPAFPAMNEECQSPKRHPYLQMLDETPAPLQEQQQAHRSPGASTTEANHQSTHRITVPMTVITEEVLPSADEQASIVRGVEKDASSSLPSAMVEPNESASSPRVVNMSDLRWTDQGQDERPSVAHSDLPSVSRIAFSPSRRHNLDLHGHLFAHRQHMDRRSTTTGMPTERSISGGVAHDSDEMISAGEKKVIAQAGLEGDGTPPDVSHGYERTLRGFDVAGFVPSVASPTSSSRYVAAATSMLYAKQDAARRTVAMTASKIFQAAKQAAVEKSAPLPSRSVVLDVSGDQSSRAAPNLGGAAPTPATTKDAAANRSLPFRQALNVDLANSFQDAKRQLDAFSTPARRTLDPPKAGMMPSAGGLYMPKQQRGTSDQWSLPAGVQEERVRLQQRLVQASPMVRDAMLRNPELLNAVDERLNSFSRSAATLASQNVDVDSDGFLDVMCVKCGCMCKQRMRDGAVLFHH